MISAAMRTVKKGINIYGILRTVIIARHIFNACKKVFYLVQLGR